MKEIWSKTLFNDAFIWNGFCLKKGWFHPGPCRFVRTIAEKSEVIKNMNSIFEFCFPKLIEISFEIGTIMQFCDNVL